MRNRASHYRQLACWQIGLALAILAGALLRLIWPLDIEFKEDEAWMFDKVQHVGQGEPLPWLGQPSSVHVCTPGMSVWVFVLLSKLFAAHDPPSLARAVQITNLAALVLLVVFSLRLVPEEEREAWLWAAALVAVNPLAVLFHRKFWMPSVFPILTLVLLTAWWKRHRGWGAFLWGLVGACLGQIEMAGFFFAAGFVLWALAFDRKQVRWLGWFTGSCLGSLPLLPWLGHLLAELSRRSIHECKWEHLIEFKFWLRWLTEPLGLSLNYALDRDFSDFLGFPTIAGRQTHFLLGLHVVVLVLGCLVFFRGARRLCQEAKNAGSTGFQPLNFRQGASKFVFDRLTGKNSPTAFTVAAALWGYGLLLTAARLPIHRHYFIILFPLVFVWFARLALGTVARESRIDDRPSTIEGNEADVHPPSAILPARRSLRLARVLLLLLCVFEALISAGFLSYIHFNRREIHGAYGTPYRVQARAHTHHAGIPYRLLPIRARSHRSVPISARRSGRSEPAFRGLCHCNVALRLPSWKSPSLSVGLPLALPSRPRLVRSVCFA